MGYSTPKKPLDLKEFLSTPGKKPFRRPLNFRAPAPLPDTKAADPATEATPDAAAPAARTS